MLHLPAEDLLPKFEHLHLVTVSIHQRQHIDGLADSNMHTIAGFGIDDLHIRLLSGQQTDLIIIGMNIFWHVLTQYAPPSD